VKNIADLRDSFGNSFDPELHAVTRRNKPKLTKHGKLRVKKSPYNEFWMDDNGDMYEDFEAAQGFRYLINQLMKGAY
jgi:hypothetical protein